MAFKNFSSIEIDAIGEILNISLGASATAVSTMLGKRVDITTPDVNIVSFDDFDYADLEPAVGVEITYVSGLSGSNIMLLKRHDVKVIVELLMGMQMTDEEFELNEMNMSAMCEVMNQMMGASSTALSEFLGEVVNISTPISFEVGEPAEFKKKCFDGQGYMVVVNFNLKIEELIESRFMYLMTVQLAKRLVSVFGLGDDEDDIITTETPAPAKQTASEPESSDNMVSEEEADTMMQEQMTEPESSNKMMSQGEIEAMMQQQMTEEKSSNKMMSQGEVEAMMQQATPQPMSAAPANDVQKQMMQMMQMMQQQMMAMQQVQPKSQKLIETKSVDTPQFHAMADNLGEEQSENLQLIMDVPLEISVEIGRTKKLIKDILELSSGSLVVLDKLAGEQVDIYANGQCIAKGDVVVVDDNFGVRVTEVIKRPELLQQ